jgi:hypothetical protein
MMILEKSVFRTEAHTNLLKNPDFVGTREHSPKALRWVSFRNRAIIIKKWDGGGFSVWLSIYCFLGYVTSCFHLRGYILSSMTGDNHELSADKELQERGQYVLQNIGPLFACRD